MEIQIIFACLRTPALAAWCVFMNTAPPGPGGEVGLPGRSTERPRYAQIARARPTTTQRGARAVRGPLIRAQRERKIPGVAGRLGVPAKTIIFWKRAVFFSRVSANFLLGCFFRLLGVFLCFWGVFLCFWGVFLCFLWVFFVFRASAQKFCWCFFLFPKAHHTETGNSRSVRAKRASGISHCLYAPRRNRASHGASFLCPWLFSTAETRASNSPSPQHTHVPTCTTPPYRAGIFPV